MEETLISFETAKLAKEKGFKESSKYCYREDGFLYIPRISGSQIMHSNILDGDNCSAPTQGLLQKWLREKHNLHVLPILNWYPDRYNYEILRENEAPLRSKSIESSYEQALEAGLYEALKLIE